jgi:hypothetical protein
MFMMNLRTQFHASFTNWSIVKTIRPKAEYRFRAAAMLFFEILKHMTSINVTIFQFFLANQTSRHYFKRGQPIFDLTNYSWQFVLFMMEN